MAQGVAGGGGCKIIQKKRKGEGGEREKGASDAETKRTLVFLSFLLWFYHSLNNSL
jgi:hypothetical protein